MVEVGENTKKVKERKESELTLGQQAATMYWIESRCKIVAYTHMA